MIRASSKDDPQLHKHPQHCDARVGEKPTVPSVTPPPSDDDSSRNPDEPAPSDPPSKPHVAKRQRLTDAEPKATPSKRTKTQTHKENANGPQHVYFGRGKPITTHPGNIRFRSIVAKYRLEYEQTSNHSHKLDIKKRIVKEVRSDGSKFFFVEEMKGNASQDPAEVEKKVLDKTRRALIDTWRSRAKWWKWADPDQEKLSWSPYSNKDGTALEKMFRKDEDHRTEVPVSIRKETYLVDVSSMIMHRVDAYGNKIFPDLRVSRKDPDDDGTIDPFDLWMSTVIPDAPEAPMQNSDFKPFSSDQRLSPAASAPMKTMPGNVRPDVVRAKNLIKTKYEKKHEVKAKAGLACWSWADPANEQLLWSNYPTGDPANEQLLWSNYPTGDEEQLFWSDFSNEDGTALERMYQTNLHSRGEVDVTVREERHLVDVTSMMMHRAEPDVNNITDLHVRRCPPDEEIDGSEPICVSGDSDGQYDTLSSAKSSGSQSSGASETSIRSSFFHVTGGAGGVQGNLYWSLGMAQRSKDERSLFAFEASDEDVLEEITAVFEEERWNDGPSTGPPAPIATDVWTIGVRRPGLVKLKKMVQPPIGLSFGKKKDPMEADPLSIGKKKATKEKAEQNLEVLRQQATSLWRDTTTRISRHSIDAIAGAPPAVNDKEPPSHFSFDKAMENFRPHALVRDHPGGNIPESIPDPSSVANTPPTPKPIQPHEEKHALPVVHDKEPPTEKRKEESIANVKSIRHLIAEIGSQHVYFGRGNPIHGNPGNLRFRSVVDKYHLEYRRASSNSLKYKIVNRIVAEVRSDGSNFFVIVRRTGGYATIEPGVKQVLEKTGQALRDAWKYRANFWSWADPAQEQLSWTNYSNKDGIALEHMCKKELHRREKVPVSVRKEKHLVDVSSMMMHRVDAKGNTNLAHLRVRRLDPEGEEMDSGELFDMSEESLGEFSLSGDPSYWSFERDTKQSMVDPARKLNPLKVHEADDMATPTTTADVDGS